MIESVADKIKAKREANRKRAEEAESIVTCWLPSGDKQVYYDIVEIK